VQSPISVLAKNTCLCLPGGQFRQVMLAEQNVAARRDRSTCHQPDIFKTTSHRLAVRRKSFPAA